MTKTNELQKIKWFHLICSW